MRLLDHEPYRAWEPPEGFDYALPAPEPAPVTGCPDCLSLAERRRSARRVHDGSAVTDANVLLRQHQEREHG